MIIFPNGNTIWNDNLNDDQDDQDTLPKNNDLTVIIFIDHENGGSNNDLDTLTNDQIFI